MRVKTIFFFSNGNTAVTNEDGQQVPEFQSSWLLTYVNDMRRLGAEIDENCEILIPGGHRAQLFQTDEGWNWRIVECPTSTH